MRQYFGAKGGLNIGILVYLGQQMANIYYT